MLKKSCVFTSDVRVGLAPSNTFKLSSNLFTDHSKAVLLMGILFCYLCFMFVIPPCLFLAALWSTAGKVKTYCDVFTCI